MKKVLVYGISGGFGGVETFLYDMISNVERDKVRFDILTYYNTIKQQEDYEKMGVNVYTITSKHENPIKNKREMRQFFEEKAKEYDVLWCNLAELINIDILKLAKKFGIAKRIIHSHSVASTRGKLLTMLHKFHKCTIHRYATDYWACSRPAGAWFFKDKLLASDKFRVIKNAIHTHRYIFDETVRKEMRLELNLKDELVIGHVGRFSDKEKNTIFLLEIFAEILKMNLSSKLMLIGDGDDRELVNQKIDELQIRNQVIMLGYRPDVPKLMSAMDVFLLPSKMEGFGIVLIEAQTNGLHCFTSDKVVPQEVAVTDLIHFIGLEQTAEEWAKEILKTNLDNRISKNADVSEAGYDVQYESKRIGKLLVE